MHIYIYMHIYTHTHIYNSGSHHLRAAAVHVHLIEKKTA